MLKCRSKSKSEKVHKGYHVPCANNKNSNKSRSKFLENDMSEDKILLKHLHAFNSVGLKILFSVCFVMPPSEVIGLRLEL